MKKRIGSKVVGAAAGIVLTTVLVPNAHAMLWCVGRSSENVEECDASGNCTPVPVDPPWLDTLKCYMGL